MERPRVVRNTRHVSWWARRDKDGGLDGAVDRATALGAERVCSDGCIDRIVLFFALSFRERYGSHGDAAAGVLRYCDHPSDAVTDRMGTAAQLFAGFARHPHAVRL